MFIAQRWGASIPSIKLELSLRQIATQQTNNDNFNQDGRMKLKWGRAGRLGHTQN